MSCYWEQPRPMAPRHDPSRPYAEQYRIDAQQFARLFQLVSPWTCGAHTEILAERTFRLLDENMDHLIEFKAFVSCLGMTLGLFRIEFIRDVSLWTQEKGIVKQACPLNEADLWLTRWDFGTLKSPLQAPLVTAFKLPKGLGGEGSPGARHQRSLTMCFWAPRVWWWVVRRHLPNSFFKKQFLIEVYLIYNIV